VIIVRPVELSEVKNAKECNDDSKHDGANKAIQDLDMPLASRWYIYLFLRHPVSEGKQV